jgi:AcrR family transcriptional regulator
MDCFVAGVDAAVREIAEKAGVGVGTVYRHFPQSSDLIGAVFRREIDACADAAPILADKHEPFEALANWMQRYAAFIATKRGLAPALHSGNPAFEPLRAYFEQRVSPRQPPARSAPTSMPTIFWVRWRACACRPTMTDPATRGAWSLSSSTGFAMARSHRARALPAHRADRAPGSIGVVDLVGRSDPHPVKRCQHGASFNALAATDVAFWHKACLQIMYPDVCFRGVKQTWRDLGGRPVSADDYSGKDGAAFLAGTRALDHR